MIRRVELLFSFAVLFLALAPHTQAAAGVQHRQDTPLPQPPQGADSALALPPRAWAVAAAANEYAILHHTGSYLRYRTHTVDEKGDKVREIIESRDGSVARLLLLNGKPITPAQDAAEHQRLQDMLDSPDAFARHVKNDESSRKLADTTLHLFPDAMLYTYVPGQPQSGTNNGALEVVLDYQPNPAFVPPSTTAEALTGLRGRLWIDVTTRNLVRMEGDIFRPVNFGWGMIARVYPGGKLLLVQTSTQPATRSGRWIFSLFSDQVNIRAVLVKSLSVHNSIETSDYQTLPAPISYQDAIHLLLATPLPTH